MKWIAESELALGAAASCAEVLECRTFQTVRTKESRRDLVTELDIEIEGRIRAALASSPYRIVGEESFRSEEPPLGGEDTAWLVDPVDGTANLVSSVPFYAVSVGLVSRLRFVAGAVVVPPQKELFFTMGDQGAYLNDKTLKAAGTALEDSLVAAAFSGKALRRESREREFSLFGRVNDRSRGCLRLGSAAVNICYAAAGRLQAAYGLGNRLWDVAGALAVASRAGCRVYVGWAGEPFIVNYVAGAPGVADELAAMIEEEGLAVLESVGESSLEASNA